MIESFTVGVKHHVNIGDYESIEVEASVTTKMREGESIVPARKRAQELLTELQAETFEAQRKPSWFERIMTKVSKQSRNIQQMTENTR